ncbi:MAG: hypothetical protein FJ276_36840, partial [Planctomycetes bacterium]|nr:hypothetical protein [Planctomycetota bacterium]
MSGKKMDRTILFGIVAARLGFLTEAEIVAAFRRWVQDKSVSLADLLKGDRKLDAVREHAIDTVCQQLLQENDSDLFKTLAGLLPSESMCRGLSEIDAEAESILRSLEQLPAAAEPAEGGEAFKTRFAGWEAVGHETRDGVCRYEIIQEHARGGLGEVFLARDTEVGRDVALKQIQHAFAGDPACRERFLLEAEITGSLEHPGIVPVYGLGKRDERGGARQLDGGLAPSRPLESRLPTVRGRAGGLRRARERRDRGATRPRAAPPRRLPRPPRPAQRSVGTHRNNPAGVR